MLELWMLEEIKDVCQEAQFQDPLPVFKSLHKIAVEKSESQSIGWWGSGLLTFQLMCTSHTSTCGHSLNWGVQGGGTSDQW
jgi:hypothetical protein